MNASHLALALKREDEASQAKPKLQTPDHPCERRCSCVCAVCRARAWFYCGQHACSNARCGRTW